MFEKEGYVWERGGMCLRKRDMCEKEGDVFEKGGHV